MGFIAPFLLFRRMNHKGAKAQRLILTACGRLPVSLRLLPARSRSGFASAKAGRAFVVPLHFSREDFPLRMGFVVHFFILSPEKRKRSPFLGSIDLQ